MTLPVTYNPSQPVPLGTAAWHEFPHAQRPIYKYGDLWLCRLPSGEPVGYRDDRHILLVSGTRSGKGASVIIPNLCLWTGSAVVIDPKGENAIVTARRRGRGSAYCYGMMQAVHILDPFGEVRRADDDFSDLKAAFNPLDIIRQQPAYAVDEAARMAEALIVSEDSRDAFFDNAAKDALKALILHVASSQSIPPKYRNLISLRRLLLSGDRDMQRLMELNGQSVTTSGISLLFADMRRTPAYGGVVAHMGAMMDELLQTSPRTLMSILQVARTNTQFLDSPALQATLTHSTFQLSDLKTKDSTLYLCLPQRYMNSHYRWLRMITTLVLGEMERVRPTRKPNNPLLMVLDEFPALGRMRVIENAAAQIAGYGVKLMFVAQTLAQLKDTYRDNWETLVANAGVKLFFGNDDHFTREYVSKLVGETEISRWSASESQAYSRSQGQSESQQSGKSGSSTIGGSSSSGMSGNQFSFSSGASGSETAGWSHSTSVSQNVGTSSSHTQGRSQTFHKRYLLNPDEVGRVFGNRAQPAMLALVSGMQPIALKRTMYFTDESFIRGFDPHPDHPPPMTLEAREVAEREAKVEAYRREQHREAQRRVIHGIFEENRRQAREEREESEREEREKRKREEKARIEMFSGLVYSSARARRQARARLMLRLIGAGILFLVAIVYTFGYY